MAGMLPLAIRYIPCLLSAHCWGDTRLSSAYRTEVFYYGESSQAISLRTRKGAFLFPVAAEHLLEFEPVPGQIQHHIPGPFF